MNRAPTDDEVEHLAFKRRGAINRARAAEPQYLEADGYVTVYANTALRRRPRTPLTNAGKWLAALATAQIRNRSAVAITRQTRLARVRYALELRRFERSQTVC